MNEWLQRLTPRQHGVVIMGCSVLLVALNFAVGRWDRYYPALFPIAGLVFPMGLFMLVTAHGTDDMAKRKVAQPIMMLVFIAMLSGAGAGLYANSVFFGRPWG